jgi:hypothetical protein
MAWWLFGEEGARRFAEAGPASAPGSLTLPDGGLTILRRGRTRATIDHGPHGYLALAAHGHADALRLDISWGEQELIVDPGVGSYFSRADLRDAFRGTGFHATVLVDGLDSSVSGGPFLWVKHASSTLLAADPGTGFAAAAHDGYERLADPVTHRRAIVALAEGSLVVIDRLEARGTHRYSQRWPLHPTLELELRTDRLIAARNDETGVLLVSGGSHAVTLDAVRGRVDPPAGWWSERLESAVPSWLLSFDLEAAGTAVLCTLVAPFRGSVPRARLEVDVTPALTRVTVERSAGVEVLEVDLGSESPVLSRSSTLSDDRPPAEPLAPRE